MRYLLKVWYADSELPRGLLLTADQVDQFVRPEVGFLHDMLTLEGQGVRRITLEVQA